MGNTAAAPEPEPGPAAGPGHGQGPGHGPTRGPGPGPAPGPGAAPGSGSGADPGLYGPASVTWQCHGDPMMWIMRRPGALPPGAPPARRPRRHAEFRLPPGRLGPAAAHRRFRRHPHLRHQRGRRTPSRRQGPGDPPRALSHRSGHRRTLPRRRPRAAAVDPLRADRQLPARPAPLRRPPHRRPGRPLRRREPRQRPPRRPRSGRMSPPTPPGSPPTSSGSARSSPPTPTRTPWTTSCEARPSLPSSCLAETCCGARSCGLAYGSLPGWAHQLYGRPAPAPRSTTRRLRLTGRVLRSIPAGLRWKLPPGHILKAMRRMGPGSRPSPYTLRTSAAILDRPGRA